MTQFGFRVPDFPVDGTTGSVFVQQFVETMEVLRGHFASAWVADHFVPWANFQSPTTDTYECWTTLCYLAGLFKDYTLGSIVMSQSYRNPALIAKMGATLQALTGGRFVLGIGAGWKRDEYAAYGIEFPSPATRIHQLEEAVQIIRSMWTQTHSTFHGRYYHVDDAICEPKPQPAPPLLIGGGGKQLTLKVVAQYADWWNLPGGTYENYRSLLDVLRGHCDTVGRDYDSIVKTWGNETVAVAPAHDAALKMAQASPFYSPESALVGTPDKVAAQLQRFTALGVQHFILRFADFPRNDSAKLFIKEVLPRFRS
ncbi:MAG: LLM class flavin-dependent oxidoreductase [Chloroflexi bacterium]|nr:LLM class flavin-dependent oxidoreductase [Chloroflexota bacterium]